MDTGQQWAEVNFVPNWIGHSKTSPEYRFIATRERLIEQPLPAMEGQMELPFPAMGAVPTEAGTRSSES